MNTRRLARGFTGSCLLAVLLLAGQAATAAWKVRYWETFEQGGIVFSQWQEDDFPDRDTFSERGSFFTRQGITSPTGYRHRSSFGKGGWLTAESYSRHRGTPPEGLLSITADPSGSDNKVLRLTSAAHTDATVIRSSMPLTGKYRVSLKVGFADFGSGEGLNGYDGDELAGPWVEQPALNENGFYWLAVADTIPRPHNNVWWHHHRKLVIDSDNHFSPWMRIWNGNGFIRSGRNPIMMFALDGRGKSDARTGKPFISFSNSRWQPSGVIKAIDAYLKEQWYEVSIARDEEWFTLSVSGRFAYGGQRDYVAVIDARRRCVWHYNRGADRKNPACHRQSGPEWSQWSEHGTWPDYFFFGDPHINYYEGKVYFDDITLEIWEDEKR